MPNSSNERRKKGYRGPYAGDLRVTPTALISKDSERKARVCHCDFGAGYPRIILLSSGTCLFERVPLRTRARKWVSRHVNNLPLLGEVKGRTCATMDG
ncbi:hypothetical protein CEXT_704241 [Caerostris extrusa]|uniref:Uncharacterized protein n=1 Tax=Caerostris extrusa TaxID=172846 RepID=A0AAV4X9V5_CAEEX|nr:hypothetical protein CEXT_704241 [Caerostris extrusa]